MRGHVACWLYRPAAARRIFHNLLHYLPEIQVRLYIRLHYNTTRNKRENAAEAERRITATIEHNLQRLLPSQPYPQPEESYAAERVVNVLLGPGRPALSNPIKNHNTISTPETVRNKSGGSADHAMLQAIRCATARHDPSRHKSRYGLDD